MKHERTQINSLVTLQVAELACRANVTPATIRYYTRVGLLQPGRDQNNGYRYFSLSDMHRVVFIRKAQSLGLTIRDIKIILQSADQGEVPCDQVKLLVEQRYATITSQIDELQATKNRIADAKRNWESMGKSKLGNEGICPLIEQLDSLNLTTQDMTSAQ